MGLAAMEPRQPARKAYAWRRSRATAGNERQERGGTHGANAKAARAYPPATDRRRRRGDHG